ncbi:carboxypeptidase-like regulatory domain-containing protein [Spirosoma foliorum]|uniref:Carboxypeptidase-like regulatory domain-containing protein n=1 Tax=Spirosoma foliorum TaxID=2710596 RepID=A0A7G5GQS7_9BACT|nr:carboxypeptidase-like regulatory domain-containing protein [Spirosoma foliorum]QMW01219.1 carboxypeptidase-like regulatory domain-containing protein [Spirosoma foliorum]
MKPQYLLPLPFLICAHITLGQRIQGKILSSFKEGIPFASIQVVGTSKGTTTNEHGEFNLQLPSIPCQILVSSIGYQTVTQRIDHTTKPVVITLPEGVALQEVRVMPDSILKTILTGAFRKIQSNYPHKTFALEGFYRELNQSTDSDELVHYGEAYLKVVMSGYQATNEDAQVEVIKARINKNPGRDSIETTRWYGGAFIANSNDLVKTRAEFLNPNSFNKRYRYTLAAVTPYNSDSLYVINFSSKDREESATGTLWIHKKSLAYVKITYQSSRALQHDLIRRFISKNRLRECRYIEQNGIWHLAHIAHKTTFVNKQTKRETTHDLAFITTQYDEQGTPVPYDKRLAYGAIFSDLTNEYDPEFWDKYTSLEADSAQKSQMAQFKAISQTQQAQQYVSSKTRRDKLVAVLKKLSISYGIGVAQYAQQSPILTATYQHKSFENPTSFPSGHPILLFRTSYGFRLTNHVKLDVINFQSVLNNDYYKSIQAGFTYSLLVKKKGNPLFLYALGAFAWSQTGCLLTELTNSEGFVDPGKQLNTPVKVFYADRGWAGVGGFGFTFQKKRRDYFIESNYRFVLTNTPSIIFKESGNLFNKKVITTPDQTDFQLNIANNTSIVQPVGITLGIRWHF